MERGRHQDPRKIIFKNDLLAVDALPFAYFPLLKCA